MLTLKIEGPQLISVAVPVPFLDLLTYRVPESMPAPVVGARVRVPVGSRLLTGVVVDADVPPTDVELKDVVELLDQQAYLPPSIVELCRWTADYYLAGLGDTVSVALPPGAKGRKSAFKTRRVAAITAHGSEMVRLKADPTAPDAGVVVGAVVRMGLQTRPRAELTAKQLAALDVLVDHHLACRHASPPVALTTG